MLRTAAQWNESLTYLQEGTMLLWPSVSFVDFSFLALCILENECQSTLIDMQLLRD